jgi:hypothetical protein
VKHYVVALAHNEVARKMNAAREDFVKLNWMQRAAAQFTNVGTSRLSTFGWVAEERRS